MIKKIKKNIKRLNILLFIFIQHRFKLAKNSKLISNNMSQNDDYDYLYKSINNNNNNKKK
jgi:hypothetical protein